MSKIITVPTCCLVKMYAQKAAPRPDSYTPTGPKPVFLRSTDVRNIDEKPLAGEELYLSVANTVQKDKIVGIQQIRNLWRIYLTSHDDRVRVITDGLVIRGAVAQWARMQLNCAKIIFYVIIFENWGFKGNLTRRI